jgi:hypothetical protein
VTFTPALASASTAGSNIKNFGIGGSVAGDYHLSTAPFASPSIDAGNPDPAFNDLPGVGEGTAINDQGIYGGPDGGDPGTL